jgi:hypothetical protein
MALDIAPFEPVKNGKTHKEIVKQPGCQGRKDYEGHSALHGEAGVGLL